MEKKYVVPEGMMMAVIEHHPMKGMLEDDPNMTCHVTLRTCLEAALRWLAENPIIPTRKQWEAAGIAVFQRYRDTVGPNFSYHLGEIAAEWQRRMFLDPTPEIPEEVLDLRWSVNNPNDPNDGRVCGDHNRLIAEAFRRGQKSESK